MTATWFDGVTITVEFSPTTNPGSAPSWVDITADVMAISINRGRATEFDTFQAGTASVRLKNDTRTYDPLYSAGTYFGNLLPMRRMRIRVTYSAVTYDLFHGFVEGWPQVYDVGGKWSESNVSLVDGFKVLANTYLPDSVYAIEVAADSPSLWYRLGEVGGTVANESRATGKDGTYAASVAAGGTGLIYGSTNGSAVFDGASQSVSIPTNSPPSTGVFSIEAWLQPSASVVASSTYIAVGYSGNKAGVYEICDFTYTAAVSPASDTINVVTGTGLGTAVLSVSGARRGQTNYLAITCDGTTTTAYLNNSNTGSTAVANRQFGPNSYLIGQYIGSDGGYSASQPWFGLIDEVAVYPTTLSVGRIAAHYTAGTTPWSGDDTGARVGRVLDAIGWPSADRIIGTGSTILGPASLNAANALAYLQDLERTEQGQLYVDGASKVVFRNRLYRLTNTKATTSQGIFSTVAGATNPIASLEFQRDDSRIINGGTYQRDGGVPVSVSDATSVTTYLQRYESMSGLKGQSDTEVRDLGNWRVNLYKNPQDRLPTLTLTPRAAPSTLFPQVLGRDIGDRVTVTHTPQGIGSAISQDCLVEGVRHTFTPDGAWETVFNLSPVLANFFVLDDATFGKLDSNNVLAF